MLDIAGSAWVFTAASELAARCGDALPYEVQVVTPEDARIRVTSALPGRGAMRAAADDKLWDWPRTRAAAAARRDASVCTGALLLPATGLPKPGTRRCTSPQGVTRRSNSDTPGSPFALREFFIIQ